MSDLLVHPPIPFADVTEGELEEASRILEVPVSDLRDGVENDPANVRKNPDLVYDRFFVPTGNLLKISVTRLQAAAHKATGGVNLGAVLSALTDLEKAVITENGSQLTKTGKPGGSSYLKSIEKMRWWLQDPIGRKPPFTIFAKGSQKLPFWAWSTLPGVTCPGAGECLVDPEDPSKRGWCYSFSAWRNILPYFRQLQNTILMRLPDKSWIEADARKKFKKGQAVRLYVDGDMDSVETLDYWMHFVDRFPDNEFYGYSKSWVQFKAWHVRHGGLWPSNYVLNLSNGTSLERDLSADLFKAFVKSMMDLRNPKTGHRLVRGTFRGLRVESKFPKMSEKEAKAGKRTKSSEQSWKIHKEDVMATAKQLGITGDVAGKGVFVCPGNCGRCLPRGRHACGSRDFTGVAVVIGIH